MKKLLLIMITICIFGCSTDDTAESKIMSKVYYGDVTLFTQADVNSFGSQNYDVIVGQLQIGVQIENGINNLSPLSKLRTVNGNMKIAGTDIRDLRALSSLDSVTANLSIGANYKIKDLQGLEGLSFVGHQLTIHDNMNLLSLNGLGQLKSIHTLFISHNYALQNINGSESIKEVRNYLFIGYNRELVDLCAVRPIMNTGAFYADIINNKYNPEREQFELGACKI